MKTPLQLTADVAAGMGISEVNDMNGVLVTLIIVLGRIAIEWIIQKHKSKKARD
jgi:hypothetical protein